jgi:hypothetical protein
MNIIKTIFLAVILAIGILTSDVKAVVVDFDDLTGPMSLTREGYAGLTWEYGILDRGGLNPGEWCINYEGDSTEPYSEPYNVVNCGGATLMGIGFPTTVDILGAYFAGQGIHAGILAGIRVHGYKDGELAETTPWFTELDSHPDWFAINLSTVDRIVIESIPVEDDLGYYNLDNLTYVPVPEPNIIAMFLLGNLLANRKRFLVVLTVRKSK